MLESLTREAFEARKGEVFTLRLDNGQALPTRLAEIRKATERTARLNREPFAVVFLAPLVPALPQRIYTLDNDTMGRIEMFLVPLGPAEGEMRYEAVFS